MTPAVDPASGDTGGQLIATPELALLALGVLATIPVLIVFVWLIRVRIRESRDERAAAERAGKDTR